MNTIRFGVAGCGAIAQRKHLPALTKRRDVQITAFADINRELASKTRAMFGAGNAQVYDTVEDLINNAPVDAVCICTPNNLHKQHSIAAISAGVHVLCEKPMATNYADALAMYQAAERSNRVLHIGFQNRYTDQSVYLKRLCDKKALGSIYHVEAVAQRIRAVPTWGSSLNADIQGGGALMDIGCHVLDLSLWLTGNVSPKYVSCNTSRAIGKLGSEANRFGSWDSYSFTAEDSAFGFVVMRNGMSIALRAAWAMNTTDEREGTVSLYGEKCGAEMLPQLVLTRELEGAVCTVRPMLETKERPLAIKTERLTPGDRELDAFIDAVVNQKANLDTYCALTTMQIIDAMYRSASEQRPVMIESMGSVE